VNSELNKLLQLCARPTTKDLKISSNVEEILKNIKERGQEVVIELAKNFDRFNDDSIRVDLNQLNPKVSADFMEAFQRAKTNIIKFHQTQLPKNVELEIEQGLQCGSIYLPYQRVGLYIPGGTAPLVSTLLMTSIPAKLVGVKEIVVTTPAENKNSLCPELVYALKELEIKEVYLLGGVQAIGALAYGTIEIKKVQKIFGPGNAWVAEAKKQVSQQKMVATDLEAGPSEIVVWADDHANADFIASDLLSQLEHGTDSQGILLTQSEKLVGRVLSSLQKQVMSLSRKDILANYLERTHLLFIKDETMIIDFINEFAPEHLSIQTLDPRKDMMPVTNAGCIFLGAYTPESLGDYASGTNHVLPTGGMAKVQSGLGIADFVKRINYQEANELSLKSISKTIITLANIEGLDGHAKAVTIRCQ